MNQFRSLSHVLCRHFQLSGSIAYLIDQLLRIRDHVGSRACQILELIMSLGRYGNRQITLRHITELSGNASHVILNTCSDKDTYDHYDHTCQDHQTDGHVADLGSLTGHYSHRYQCTGGKADICTVAVNEKILLTLEIYLRSTCIRYCLIHDSCIILLSGEYISLFRKDTFFSFFYVLNNQFSASGSYKSDDTAVSDIDLFHEIRNSRRLDIDDNAGIVRLAHHFEGHNIIFFGLRYLFIQYRMTVDPLRDTSSAFPACHVFLVLIQETVHTG